MGLVLSQHDPLTGSGLLANHERGGRLQPLHHRLEAVHRCPAGYAQHAREGNMKAEDVTDTLELALQASGCDQVHVVHKPRLLSDNGSSYVSGELAEWLQGKGMKHYRGARYHPQTQGKTPSH